MSTPRDDFDEQDDSLVLVSACLAGVACRHDGQSLPHPLVLRLVAQGRAIAVCPEVLGGLPVPRTTVELAQGRAVSRTGEDLTEAFLAGARLALDLGQTQGCGRAILKSRSPSCGLGRVYDGSFSGVLVAGDGIFAALLKARGLAVWSEVDLGAEAEG